MFALKSGMGITFRVLLIAVILFNALAPTAAFAKSSVIEKDSSNSLETQNEGKIIGELTFSENNYHYPSFSRPISRANKSSRPTEITTMQTSSVLLDCVEASSITCSDPGPGTSLTETFHADSGGINSVAGGAVRFKLHCQGTNCTPQNIYYRAIMEGEFISTPAFGTCGQDCLWNASLYADIHFDTDMIWGMQNGVCGTTLSGTCLFELSGVIPAGIISANTADWNTDYFTIHASISNAASWEWLAVDTTIYVSLDPGFVSQVPSEAVSCKGGYYCPTQGFAADPINTRTGALSYSVNDLEIPTSAGALSFSRTYVSSFTEKFTSPLGYGWMHNQDIRLIFPQPNELGFVHFKDQSGNLYRFWDTGTGQYIPYTGYTASLTKNTGTPITYTLKDQSQNVYTFDQNGKITSLANPTGHAFTYTYDASGRLDRVSADGGTRFLEFHYDAQSRLESVDDHTNSRSVIFNYDANGDLDTFEDVLSQTWDYQYLNHRLTRVLDLDNNTVIRNEYYPDGRAWKQFDGNDNLITELQYTFNNPIPPPLYSFDFETGDLTGWTIVSGNAFSSLDVTNLTTAQGGNGQTFNQHGTYHLWGYKDGGDGQIGVLRSDTVTLPANPSVRLLVAGGDDINNLYVSLVRASDGTELFKATGQNSETYRQIEWDASAYAGQAVYIKAVDNSTGGWGHVNIDNVEFISMPSTPIPVLTTTVTDALGNVTTHDYDSRGTLIGETDPLNTLTDKTYDNSFRPTEITNAASQTLQMTWSADGANMLSKIDPAGNQTDYTYDSLNNLETVTDPRNFTTTYSYDGTLLINSEDPLGGDTTYTYTPEGYLESVTDTAGRETIYTYDSFGQRISMTDPSNNTWDYTYDSLGRLIDTTDPRGRVTHNEYNAAGKLIRVTQNYDSNRPQNDQNLYNIVTEYDYDVRGNQIAVTDTYDRTTPYIYDDADRLLQTIDPAGNTTTNVYDAAGRLISTTDPLLHTTTYEYDVTGRLIKTINHLGFHSGITTFDISANTSTVTDMLERSTVFHYDELGRVIEVVDDLGNSTTTTYDENGNVKTRADQLDRTTHYEYDALNRLIRTIDPNNGVTETVYDAAGNRIATIDPLDHQTTYTYDSVGRLIATTDPLNRVTQTEYDSFGRRSASIDAAGNRTTYTYDLLDRVITVTDPANHTTYTTYDALGNVLTRTDANGNTTTTTYDLLNRPLTTTDANGHTTTNTYDAGGNLIAVTDALNQTTTFTYDALNRQIAVTDPLDNTTESIYDALGNLTDTIDANGVVTHYLYDELNRQTAIILNYKPGIQPNAETNVRYDFTYNAVGNRVSVKDPNGNITTYGYDALNHVIEKQDPLQNTWAYDYDLAGNRTSVTDAKNQTVLYIYDADDQLTGINYPGTEPDVTFTYDLNGQRIGMTDGLGTTTWTYDDLNRPTSIEDAFGATVGYNYDAVGNRTGMTYPDGKTVSYTFDDVNQLTGVTDWDNQNTGYTYDAVGQLSSVSRPNEVSSQYLYDDAGRLTGLQHNAGANMLASYNYMYDPAGNRIQAIENLIGSSIPTPTSTAPPANTSTVTPSPVNTSTNTPIGPTDTFTPAATDTATIPPTDTPTNTPGGPTATSSATPSQTSTPATYTYTSQPNGTDGVDTYLLSSSPTTNNGAAVLLWVGEGNNATNRVARSLIKFDLSSIPSNAVITSATLSLWTSDDFSDNNRTIRAYRLKTAFDESQATWNESATGVNWEAAGASGANDRESTDIGSVEILANEAIGVEKQISLTPAKIEEMIDGTFTNNGLAIVADTELNDRFNYKSSDASNSSQRPKLVIEYTLPQGQAPSGHFVNYILPKAQPASLLQTNTYTSQPNGTDGIDTYLLSTSPTTNNGADVALAVGESNNATNRFARSLIKFDLSSIPSNAVITSATLSLWTTTDLSDNDRTIRVFRLKTAFDESQATWNIASTGVNWQTAGASGTNDRESADIGSFQVLANEALNTEKQISLTPAKIQEMINGTFTNNGLIIVADTELNDRFNYKSSDASNASQRPKLVIQYTISSATATPTETFTPTVTVTPSATQPPAFTPTHTPTPIVAGPLIIDYTYDALNRLTDAVYSDGRNFGYTYDAAGNVLELQQNLGPGTVTTTYTYNTANELVTALQGGTTWEYVYDANGSLIETLPNGNPANGAQRYTYNAAGYLVKTESHNGTGWNTQAEMDYNGLGQRLSMDAAGVIAHYVMDGDQPLTANSAGNTTFYLYGLGTIGEETNAWSYSLLDGTNTPRQLSNPSGGITRSARYTPWGDTLDTSGAGNFTFGYFGGVMDAATGLLYVGNGQYYDPATGRFLTRGVNPDSTNPYVPWNPIGAILGPLGLLSLFYSRKKKGSKVDTFLVLLLVVVTMGVMLAACAPEPTQPPPPLPPLEDTHVLDAPWVDEQDWDEWTTRPNSCGPAALYMFLHAEGISVDYPTLITQLAQERPGGYDGFCCSQGWNNFPTTPTPSPNGENWCNDACTSAQVLADVASKYYNLTIDSGDNWTRERVHQKLMAGHPVLALVRAEFGTTINYFGHFVLIRGLVDQGSTVIVNDSYPGDDYWNMTSEERRAIGEGRRVDWYKFDQSWASFVDHMDPLGGPNFKGHVRWAMAVR